jgi:hypothetical protein
LTNRTHVRIITAYSNACSVPGQALADREGDLNMAPLNPPRRARVRWDRAADRPSSVRWAGRELKVTRLAAVRDERHAYHPERGPLLTMVVETSSGEATLVFDAASRRWFVEAADQAA